MSTAELEQPEAPSLEILNRLSKDLMTAATALTQNEVRLIVDLYYQVQDFRIATANVVRSQDATEKHIWEPRVNHTFRCIRCSKKSKVRHRKKDCPGEPNALSAWIFNNFSTIERDISSAMGTFAAHYKVGQYLQSIYGIGPIISAGLLAHLDVRKAKTPGSFLTFAGLIDPSRQPWEKKQKRPWNAKLKTLATVRMGETFVKFSGKDECVYGKLYVKRKQLLIRQNAAGKFEDHALARSKDPNLGKDTIAYQWYSGQYPANLCTAEFFQLSLTDRGKLMKVERLLPGKGLAMLPPAHLHSRARRHMAQMVLSHLHYIMYEDYYGKTYEFLPYVHSSHYKEGSPGYHGEKHENIMMPPNWPNDELGVAPL